MTGVQDRFIRNQALRNRSQTANQIVGNLSRVTGQTIRNGLNAVHLHARYSLSRTEEPAKAGTCSRDRRALQQLALNVHVKHSDLTRPPRWSRVVHMLTNPHIRNRDTVNLIWG